MKKFLINHYVVIIQVLFIIYNTVFRNIRIGGYLYQISMLLFIASNIIALIKLKKNIKYKSLTIILYFLVCLFSKDVLQGFFGISSMITLIVIGFRENDFIKFIGILTELFIFIFTVVFPILPVLLFFLIRVDIDRGKEMYGVYEETHYYCDNNYEVYAYSASAIDDFHYNIGKHYEILNIDDIIYINYNRKQKNISEQEYEDYIKNNNCHLISNKGGG